MRGILGVTLDGQILARLTKYYQRHWLTPILFYRNYLAPILFPLVNTKINIIFISYRKYYTLHQLTQILFPLVNRKYYYFHCLTPILLLLLPLVNTNIIISISQREYQYCHRLTPIQAPAGKVGPPKCGAVDLAPPAGAL